ncbi:MAG: hypothetical protein KF754_15140 [Planctomycetes bacterium]|nr:hypothetical protein [Planctomycetota bacterium]
MRRVLPFLCVLAALAACRESEPGDPAEPGYSYFTLSPATLPSALEDTPYSAQMLAGGKLADADQQPLEWSIGWGSLPPGMSLPASSTTTNYLQGSPTTPGLYHFGIRVKSQFGSADVTFDRTLNVVPPGNLVITTVGLASGTQGSAYSESLSAAGGTGVGYTWSIISGALPPGLALDSRNGALNWGSFSQSGQLDQGQGGGMLAEASGICASRRNPGIYWVHDDSGATAELFAVDATGNVRQRYSLGYTPTDWEDIAIGPGPDPLREYLYIGDFGDNGLSRGDCHLVRVEEPLIPATPGSPIALSHERFYFMYSGGAQNCESLLIDWDTGTPYLVEKTAGAPRVQKFPMPLSAAWTAGNPVTLVSVPVGSGLPSTLTAADASRDARRVVLRGYSGGVEIARPQGASFDSIFMASPTAVAMPGGQQHEALCYSADGELLVTTTEIASGTSAPIHVSAAAPDPGFTTISGTPAAVGLYSFIVQVRDSAGNTALRGFVITIQ